MKFNNMSHNERVYYLFKPILKALQEAGGQLSRSEIKNRIISYDDDIAEYASQKKQSKKSGNEYREFDFKFNFAIKDLSFADLLEFENRNPLITLTDKGINIDIDTYDFQEVIDVSTIKWTELSSKGKDKTKESEVSAEEEKIVNNDISIEEKYNNEFEEKLLEAISKMSPKKFEVFSRKLLSKMGVEFTEKGVQVSGDGGIDGYGYHRDSSDFRTTRVVIQCKRYNAGLVSEPCINEFLGAMSKFNADYGVFLTNSGFTKNAREAAMQGKPITLIDGKELVSLVKKYQVYVKPITTYELLDFYDED